MDKSAKEKKWEILNDNIEEDVVSVLLKNRGIVSEKQKEYFFHPLEIDKILLNDLGIDEKAVDNAVERIKKTIESKETIIIYGDYDADGICSTAILWETLYSLTKKVIPHIPDRFTEGYGINKESIANLKNLHKNLGLIITVDNGIVAFGAIEMANSLGIDVIVTDHHQKDINLPKAYSIVHTDKIAGSGVAYVFAREILNKLKVSKKVLNDFSHLELAAIGTIADQLSLIGPNRSIAKFGLQMLASTKRLGLKEMFRESSITNGISAPKSIGTYEVNYVIAPRLNAMGRLKHAIDSLRLLCTTDQKRAAELADHIGNINKERQKIVDEVLLKAIPVVEKGNTKGAILISGKYHEGVIGLAAGKLVEDFGRPAIVFSEGAHVSKASARSIPGFNIIQEIKKLSKLTEGAGGHPMAAGFSIKTENIEKFIKSFEKNSSKMLTEKLLTKTIKVDTRIEFDQINFELLTKLDSFKPFGVGNPSPIFLTRKVNVLGCKTIGTDMKHLKLTLMKDRIIFEAIAFNFGKLGKSLTENSMIDIVYAIEENLWNNNRSLQLKIKDLKLI